MLFKELSYKIRRVNEKLLNQMRRNRRLTELDIINSLKAKHPGYYAKYISYARGAYKRKLSFYLTIEDFKGLDVYNCVYCGQKASGFDRYNNDLGYLRSNIVPACFQCNIMKHQASPSQFMQHIKRIYLWNYQKSSPLLKQSASYTASQKNLFQRKRT